MTIETWSSSGSASSPDELPLLYLCTNHCLVALFLFLSTHPLSFLCDWFLRLGALISFLFSGLFIVLKVVCFQFMVWLADRCCIRGVNMHNYYRKNTLHKLAWTSRPIEPSHKLMSSLLALWILFIYFGSKPLNFLNPDKNVNLYLLFRSGPPSH